MTSVLNINDSDNYPTYNVFVGNKWTIFFGKLK